MTEFTPEWIAEQRKIIDNLKQEEKECWDAIENFPTVVSNSSPALIAYKSAAKKYYRKALDHIERLQKRIEELEAVNEDQALTISQNDYAYTIDKEMMEKRIAELETYIDDCQSKPCYANKKEEARKKINDILAHALTERKEDYYLDGKYFRWGKLEKDIMEVVDNIFVDGGNENAK